MCNNYKECWKFDKNNKSKCKNIKIQIPLSQAKQMLKGLPSLMVKTRIDKWINEGYIKE